MTLQTREAFDRHALTYDEQFSSLATTHAIRRQVWHVADSLFPAGSRLLDLGCGTGEDAIHFAKRGISVTAIDIAPRMIAQCVLKAGTAGVGDLIDARNADLLTFQPDNAEFDGLFSNFGALNCIANVSVLRELAAKVLKPGAPMLLVTMGRFYPLETARFLMKGDFRRAFRRLRRNTYVSVEGVAVPVWYHGLNDLRRDLDGAFSLTTVRGLQAVDKVLARLPAMRSFSDHYISVWRYR